MDNNKDQFNKGVEQYYQAKQEGDIDLVQIVRQSLVNSGLMQNVLAHYDTNRFILEANGKPSTVQRFLLNRYWTQQLMASPSPSIEERYCLIPNGTIEDWIKLFNAKVVPFLVSNGLPNAL